MTKAWEKFRFRSVGLLGCQKLHLLLMGGHTFLVISPQHKYEACQSQHQYYQDQYDDDYGRVRHPVQRGGKSVLPWQRVLQHETVKCGNAGVFETFLQYGMEHVISVARAGRHIICVGRHRSHRVRRRPALIHQIIGFSRRNKDGVHFVVIKSVKTILPGIVVYYLLAGLHAFLGDAAVSLGGFVRHAYGRDAGESSLVLFCYPRQRKGRVWFHQHDAFRHGDDAVVLHHTDDVRPAVLDGLDGPVLGRIEFISELQAAGLGYLSEHVRHYPPDPALWSFIRKRHVIIDQRNGHRVARLDILHLSLWEHRLLQLACRQILLIQLVLKSRIAYGALLHGRIELIHYNFIILRCNKIELHGIEFRDYAVICIATEICDCHSIHLLLIQRIQQWIRRLIVDVLRLQSPGSGPLHITLRIQRALEHRYLHPLKRINVIIIMGAVVTVYYERHVDRSHILAGEPVFGLPLTVLEQSRHDIILAPVQPLHGILPAVIIYKFILPASLSRQLIQVLNIIALILATLGLAHIVAILVICHLYSFVSLTCSGKRLLRQKRQDQSHPQPQQQKAADRSASCSPDHPKHHLMRSVQHPCSSPLTRYFRINYVKLILPQLMR